MRNSLYLFVFFLLLLTSSCQSEGEGSGVSSGRIDYKITYLNSDLNKKTKEMLPSHMRLSFNEKQAVNNIEGFMGIYRLNATTNFHTRKCSTMLKVFDKYYLFKGERDEQMCCFDTMDDMKVEETNETKTIAGFICKKAVVTLPGKNESFNIYYTNEISLKHPNVTNPYREIKGVLMEFELNLSYLRMHFVAENFQTLKNSSKLNNKCPDDARIISRDNMTQILNRLME
jgi:GLPGLI family protein